MNEERCARHWAGLESKGSATLVVDATPTQIQQSTSLVVRTRRRRRIGLLRGWIRLSRTIRNVPSGILLLMVGLWFPVGPEIGSVTITLVDVTIVALTVLMLLGGLVYSRRLWVPLSVAWIVFLLGALGSTVFSHDMGESIVHLIEKVEMFLLFYLVLNLVHRHEAVTGLMIVFILCGIINAIFGLMQFFGLTTLGLHGDAFFGRMSHTRGVGFIGGTFGAFLGTAIVLLGNWLFAYWQQWSRGVRWLCLIGLSVLTFGLIVTLVRTWVFATALALSLVALRWNWRARLRLVSIAVLALGVFFLALNHQWFDLAGEHTTQLVHRRLLAVSQETYYSSLKNIRYDKWRNAWNDFLNAPIFGVGMGVERFPTPVGTMGLVDNHYLELLAEMGLVGTVGFLWISVGTMWRTWRAVQLTRRDARLSTSLGLFSSQVLWLSGGVLWGLFGSGKPGMMFFLLAALAVAHRRVLMTEDHSHVGLIGYFGQLQRTRVATRDAGVGLSRDARP